MLDREGIPTVGFMTEPFRALANGRRQALGVPDLPIVFLPHPMMSRSAAEVDAIAAQKLDEALGHLLAPARS